MKLGGVFEVSRANLGRVDFGAAKRIEFDLS